jgi:hypothetical protein
VLIFFLGSSLFLLAPLLPEKGPPPKEPALEDNEAPKATERQDGDDVEDSLERTESNQSPPSANTQGKEEGRKRKRQDDLKSSGTSKSQDVPHGPSTSSAPSQMLSWFDLAGTES